MQLDKGQIIDKLKSLGDNEKASRAEAELPDKLDTDRDSGLLDKFGVNVKDLIGKIPGLGG